MQAPVQAVRSDQESVAEQVDLEKLRADFKAKYELYFQLVGSLWPPIVYEQLRALRDEYRRAGGNTDDLVAYGSLPSR